MSLQTLATLAEDGEIFFIVFVLQEEASGSRNHVMNETPRVGIRSAPVILML